MWGELARIISIIKKLGRHVCYLIHHPNLHPYNNDVSIVPQSLVYKWNGIFTAITKQKYIYITKTITMFRVYIIIGSSEYQFLWNRIHLEIYKNDIIISTFISCLAIVYWTFYRRCNIHVAFNNVPLTTNISNMTFCFVGHLCNLCNFTIISVNVMQWFLLNSLSLTHMCVSKLAIIGLDNGLSHWRRQANIWNNARISLIGPLGRIW